MLKLNETMVLYEDKGYIAVAVSDMATLVALRAMPMAVASSNIVPSMVLLPWCDDVCRVLTNMGYDMTMASPFMFSQHPLVEGKYTGMAHQLITAAFVCLHPRSYVLSDPRTGKTGSLILAMDYLQRNRMVTGGFLIATTVTTMQSVWVDGIKGTIPNAKVVIAHQATRASALKEPADFYITNYDSVRLSTKDFVNAVLEQRIGGCVIDELTHLGNASSKRFKAFNAVLNQTNMEYVIGLTGSPGNNPEAIYGMCSMVNRGRLKVRTKTAWLNMVTYRYGPEPYMVKNTADAPRVFHEVMQPAIRFAKKDILDLPPVVTQDRVCDLSKEQRDMREQFVAAAIALTKTGERITAANGGVAMQKLMQTALGFCMDNNGKPIELEHPSRAQTIIDIIGETDRKVVVFSCYKASMKMRLDEIRAAGYTAELISGDVSGAERARILHDFQYSDAPHVLVAHPQTVSYGVELSRSDTMIFDGPPMLGGFVYAQALERLSSAKQTAAHISIIRVMSSPEEKRGFAMLDAGKTFSDTVAALFEEFKKSA